jgi:hypothetical protein
VVRAWCRVHLFDVFDIPSLMNVMCTASVVSCCLDVCVGVQRVSCE